MPRRGGTPMCKKCDAGIPQTHSSSRRDFLKATAATGAAAAAAGADLFTPRPAAAHDGDPPEDTGRRGRRYVIRGGHVMTMDPSMPNKGEFAQADVLIEGKQILAVGPNLHAGGAAEIDARGKIVMPGFIDTHHHQFETALRSFLADGVLINDKSGSVAGSTTYFEYVLLTFAPVYRPEDVYISELFGGLSQLGDGVTTVHDVSQIHHSPQHSDAAIKALFDTGRRAAFGYFESAGGVAGNQYPFDAPRIKKQFFSSSDQLVHMIMGGEVYLGPQSADDSWRIGRELGLQIAAHILSPFGIRPIFDSLAAGTRGNVDRHGLPLLADAARRSARPADDPRRAALRHHQRRKAPAPGQEDRLAHPGQGSRHHHPRCSGDQCCASQQRAGGGGVAHGSNQRRDGDRRRQGAQVEGQVAGCQPRQPAPAAREFARSRIQRGPGAPAVSGTV